MNFPQDQKHTKQIGANLSHRISMQTLEEPIHFSPEYRNLGVSNDVKRHPVISYAQASCVGLFNDTLLIKLAPDTAHIFSSDLLDNAFK